MKRSMKIKALALAIAAVSTAPAFAQNVQVYGLVDVGYLNQKKTDGATNGTLKSISNETGSGASHLGFQGSEDLGNGLKAKFQLELQLGVDNGTLGSPEQFRQSWVALAGSFGQLTLGRDYAPTFLAAFGGEYCGWCGIGSIAGLTQQGLRQSNMVKYNTPSFGGFSGALSHSAGETLNANTGNVDEVAAFYSAGPVNVAYAHRDNKTAATVKQKGNYLTGNFDFGMGKVYALFGTEKNSTSTVDEKYSSLGLMFRVGGGDLAFEAIRVKDKTAGANDSRMASVAYFYPLSKRTKVYAQYAKVTNETGAARNVYAGSNGFSSGATPATLAAGQDTQSYTVGLRHSF